MPPLSVWMALRPQTQPPESAPMRCHRGLQERSTKHGMLHHDDEPAARLPCPATPARATAKKLRCPTSGSNGVRVTTTPLHGGGRLLMDALDSRPSRLYKWHCWPGGEEPRRREAIRICSAHDRSCPSEANKDRYRQEAGEILVNVTQYCRRATRPTPRNTPTL